MIRMVLERVVLFLLPFALFAAYVMVAHRWRGVRAPATPWMWLTVTGLLLVIASFLYVGFTQGETTQGIYVAPQLVDGKVVPGHVDPNPPPPPPPKPLPKIGGDRS